MKKICMYATVWAMMAASCATHHYEVAEISRESVLIDKTFDAGNDSEAEAFMKPYKTTVDSVMGPVVGRSAQYLFAKKPESNLSNLLCDILIWASGRYGEKPAFAIYNMGGIRAAISAGDVTYGNVLDVAPFENKICFFDLKGCDVLELFRQIAHNYGEGVSRGVKMEIAKDGSLLSVKLHGQDINPEATYRMASIDYLAQGNDGLTVLKKKTNVNSPQEASNNSRFLIMEYFREQAAQGKAVEAKVEGRIVVKE